MKTSDFDYYLPQELVAQHPAKKRDQSRLMVLDPIKQTIVHRKFSDIVDYLNVRDLLVMNDTKVIPANLIGRKMGGTAKIKVLLLRREVGDERWECLVKPGKRLKVGSKITFGEGELIGTVLEKKESGEQVIQFECEHESLEQIIERLGEVPLPPYIRLKTKDPSFASPSLFELRRASEGRQRPKTLKERYQTVYAEKPGASAAPTAGLHFTKELLNKIKAKGIQTVFLTLHTGLATFRPVYAENVEDHKMHKESYFIPQETIEKIKKAKRVVAVGTTSVRALESCFNSPPPHSVRFPPLLKREGDYGGELRDTNLFIHPGYKFKVVNAMITNFHFPRSTLLMMISAFAGRDFIFRAYEEAIRMKYRFFSFGDAMLILSPPA